MKSTRRPLYPKDVQSLSLLNENNASYEVPRKKLAVNLNYLEKENYSTVRKKSVLPLEQNLVFSGTKPNINNSNEENTVQNNIKNFIANTSIENYLTEEQMKNPKLWFDLVRSAKNRHSTADMINCCLFAFSKMDESLLLNDKDYLLFCFLYLHLLPDKEKVRHCSEMYSRNVGRKSAQFYKYWAYFSMTESKSIENKLAIISLGIENDAEPIELLKTLEQTLKTEISKNLSVKTKNYKNKIITNNSSVNSITNENSFVDATTMFSSSQSSSLSSMFSLNRSSLIHKNNAILNTKNSNLSSPNASNKTQTTFNSNNNFSPNNNDSAVNFLKKVTPRLANFSLGGNFRGGAKRQIVSSSGDINDASPILGSTTSSASIDTNRLVTSLPPSSQDVSQLEISSFKKKNFVESTHAHLNHNEKVVHNLIPEYEKQSDANGKIVTCYDSNHDKVKSASPAVDNWAAEKSSLTKKIIENTSFKNLSLTNASTNNFSVNDQQAARNSNQPSATRDSEIIAYNSVTDKNSLLVEKTASQVESKSSNILQWSQACNLIGAKLFTIKEVPYMMLCEIGKGGSSRVYKVLSPDFNLFALKVVCFEDQEMLDQMMNEVKLLISLRGKYRNIIELFDASVNFERRELTILLEHAEVDLHRFLTERHLQYKESHQTPENSLFKGKMAHDLDGLKFYWKSMLMAVKIVHDHKIVHGDLKPTNFVLVKGHLKLIDFGIAKTIENNTKNIKRNDIVGTLNYMSPESVMSESKGSWKVSLPSDVWSLGCILYQMVFGTTPFEHIKNLTQKLLAISGKNGSKIVIPHLEDANLHNVIQSCLQRVPNQRPKIMDLLSHPFLSGSVH